MRAKGYLVKLKDDASRTEVLKQVKLTGIDFATDWKVFNGFYGDLDEESIDFLRASEDVESISENGFVRMSGRLTQTNAPWGLGRTSPDSDDSLSFLKARTSAQALNYTYTYDSSAVTGVDVYVVDSGVYVEHEQFGGRARWGTTSIGTPNIDYDGHGTHCAGVVASQQFGIAKNASIIAVKVFSDDGGGYISSLVSGFDWVLKATQKSGRPSVVATSLEAWPHPSLEAAVIALMGAGVHFVAAAGNGNTDVSYSSPANLESVIAVGATAIDDSRARFSNYGEVLDISAPGVQVISTYIGSPNATASMNGTSMASPHVSSAIAYLIALEGNITPKEMSEKLKKPCIRDAITGLPADTTSCLLHLP